MPTIPSVWRITRTYLSQRESAAQKDILKAIRKHRPNLTNRQFHDKMHDFENRGVVKHVARATLALTQDGRLDLRDPEEAIGLPTWVPPAAVTTDAIVEVTRQAPTKPASSRNSVEHMAMMRAAKQAKKISHRTGKPMAWTCKPRTPEQLKATRELRAKLKAERRAPFSSQQARGEAQPATIKIAGQETAVNEELIAKLLNTNEELKRAINLPDVPLGKPGRLIDLPIGIRLKISVEVV